MNHDKGELEIEKISRSDSEDVLIKLQSSFRGLTDYEVKLRLQKDGHNTLAKQKHTNIIVQFLSHFANPLIIILMIASVISYFMHESTDAIIIMCMILFGVLLDFFQEYSADKALKKLLESVRTTAIVIRNEKEVRVTITDLAVGDLISVSAGDMIPADARIIECKDFHVNQSSLTGESYPSEKISGRCAHFDGLDSYKNILFSGTSVISGSATAVIFRTGKSTEFGKISEKLAVTNQKSEFELGMNSFGYFIMKMTFMLVIFIFLFNSVVKHEYLISFMFAIAIAVGMTPELLPMIMSVTMTAGSKKMAKKGVLVKKLSAIPNFGSMNILCTDKTGTLTENRIKVVRYTDFAGKEDINVLHLAYLNSYFETGIKNPMDDAILKFKKTSINGYRKFDEIPYDFFRKRMSVVVSHKKNDILITKGAPEEIMKICDHYINGENCSKFDDKIRKRAQSVYHQLSSDGFRVLAIARKHISPKKSYSKSDEMHMEFAGFISFLDPPKKEVRKSIKDFENLGIEIKVITGDNEFVTKKICHEVGLEVKGILLGDDTEGLTDRALLVKASNITIFARFSPTQKNRIINVLKQGNNVVGYLGDGINDAPSLKAADVGISVDNAADIAKEAADLVLTKKSLHDLKEGIVEGRKTFANTMKYVMMTISSNFGNMFSASLGIIFLPFLPMLPIQILLNNLIYDFSQVTIPTDNVDKDWTQKPKRWNIKFIKQFMYVFGPISSFFDILTFIVLFYFVHATEGMFQTGWFMESLATQTLIIFIIRTKHIPFLQSAPSLPLILTSLGCVIFGWILPYTSIGAYFKFEPLPLDVMIALGLIVVTYLLTVHIAKMFFFAKHDF